MLSPAARSQRPAAADAASPPPPRRGHRFGPAATALAALLLAGITASLLWWAWPRHAPPAAATVSAGAAVDGSRSGGSADRASQPGAAGATSTPPAPPQTPRLSTAELLAGHSSDWRIARLRDDPAVLVIEFPGLAAQGSAMNRIAALLEKADAPRDRVLDDDELARLIARSGDNAQTFYQGHDYDSAGLGRFFTLARRQNQPLNADEQRLRRLLAAEGLLADPDFAATSPPAPQSGPQALITFTATQPDNPATPNVDETLDARRRESVLLHESSHGRFYTRAVYREHCRRFWREVLTAAQRERIRGYLASLGYDRRDEELMLNEAQAFLMHTPDTRAFAAKSIGMTDDELAALRTAFWRSLPADGGAVTR